MTWTPVSRERFESILTEEVGSLAPEVLRTYEQYAVAPYQHRCVRNENSGTEYIFVVAKAGNRVLFYDDVEEEFGVEVPDVDGVLRNWGTYGPLVRALHVLDDKTSAL